jgi:hypothetical protein
VIDEVRLLGDGVSMELTCRAVVPAPILSCTEPPETLRPLFCPGCGRLPCRDWHCLYCYDPVPDCTELELLHGQDCASWNAAVRSWLDGQSDAELQKRAWAASGRHEADRDGGQHQRLERMLRDELTRRHHECSETIPPPPGLPREERETVRPGV